MIRVCRREETNVVIMEMYDRRKGKLKPQVVGLRVGG